MKADEKDNYAPMKNPHKKNTGLKRVFIAFNNSITGLKFAIKEESAFRQEILLSLILLPLAFWLPVPAIFKILMISSVFLVLIIELVNSSIEATIDRISYDYHDLSKRAKDYGSAAVFLSLLLVTLIYSSAIFIFISNIN